MSEIDNLKEVIADIEAKKMVIAKKRDEIREIYDDLASILESFDVGVEGLDNGIREIIHAIDSISEVV